MKKLSLILIILILNSCAKPRIEYSYPQDPEIERKSRAGKFFNDDVVLYGQKEKADKNQDQQHNKLFLSAKNVIAAMIEIDVEDEELGIISTKWSENKSSKERTKISVLIKGEEPKSENIEIAIHKKIQDEKGQWENKYGQNKKSDNEDLLIKLLKEKIIAIAK